MPEEMKMVPSAKVMLLGSICLILMISVGGALGFSEVAKVFQHRLDDAIAYETFYYVDPDMTPFTQIKVSIGIDMKENYNETFGMVYWYHNVTVNGYSNIVDVLGNLSNCELMEKRVYNLSNPSDWESTFGYNASNYIWDVEYYNFSGYMYIHRIGNISEDSGSLTQWLVYRWSNTTQNFEYIVQSTTKFTPSNNDLVVLLYSQLGVLPTDCCSGGGFQYDDYQGPG
jgi:hypothetical protein